MENSLKSGIQMRVWCEARKYNTFSLRIRQNLERNVKKSRKKTCATQIMTELLSMEIKCANSMKLSYYYAQFTVFMMISC